MYMSQNGRHLGFSRGKRFKIKLEVLKNNCAKFDAFIIKCTIRSFFLLKAAPLIGVFSEFMNLKGVISGPGGQLVESLKYAPSRMYLHYFSLNDNDYY